MQKVVKRKGQLKLVIEPGDVTDFIVFADCRTDAQKLRKPEVRKGSFVSIRGELQSFGWSALCLIDCKLDEVRRKKKGKRREKLINQDVFKLTKLRRK